MKKDKYLRARGGTAHMINVNCAVCKKRVLFYCGEVWWRWPELHRRPKG